MMNDDNNDNDEGTSYHFLREDGIKIKEPTLITTIKMTAEEFLVEFGHQLTPDEMNEILVVLGNGKLKSV